MHFKENWFRQIVQDNDHWNLVHNKYLDSCRNTTNMAIFLERLLIESTDGALMNEFDLADNIALKPGGGKGWLPLRVIEPAQGSGKGEKFLLDFGLDKYLRLGTIHDFLNVDEKLNLINSQTADNKSPAVPERLVNSRTYQKHIFKGPDVPVTYDLLGNYGQKFQKGPYKAIIRMKVVYDITQC